LIGQIQHPIWGLKAELQHGEPMIILDLEEAFLVDVDAIRFLAECDIQESTIVRFNVRDWIARETKGVSTPVASGAKPGHLHPALFFDHRPHSTWKEGCWIETPRSRLR
jgi:hypothetical protein